LPVTLTVPATTTSPEVIASPNAVLSVEFVIASEKVAVIAEFTATAVEAFAGEVEDTIGGVVSDASVVPVATCDCPETFPAASTARTV